MPSTKFYSSQLWLAGFCVGEVISLGFMISEVIGAHSRRIARDSFKCHFGDGHGWYSQPALVNHQWLFTAPIQYDVEESGLNSCCVCVLASFTSISTAGPIRTTMQDSPHVPDTCGRSAEILLRWQVCDADGGGNLNSFVCMCWECRISTLASPHVKAHSSFCSGSFSPNRKVDSVNPTSHPCPSFYHYH
jgi:hypothetical protein